MKYQTRDFGEVELDASKTIDLVQPIFGFEDYHSYTLLFDPEIGTHISWLQSLEEPSLCFTLVDPETVTGYVPMLTPAVEKALGRGTYACWAVAVFREDMAHSTANLKSPVLINMETRRGMQLILDQDYPVRYSLAGEGTAEC